MNLEWQTAHAPFASDVVIPEHTEKPSSTGTASEGLPVSGPDSHVRYPWPHSLSLQNVMRRRQLSELEIATVEAAVTHLQSSIHGDSVMTESCLGPEAQQREAWKLLLDTDWRNAGIRGNDKSVSRCEVCCR